LAKSDIYISLSSILKRIYTRNFHLELNQKSYKQVLKSF